MLLGSLRRIVDYLKEKEGELETSSEFNINPFIYNKMGRRLERKLEIRRLLSKVHQQCARWTESMIVVRQLEVRREIFKLNNPQNGNV